MFEDLTFQQFCALDHQRNMVVTAGPGAGKTRILSHRFCFILLTDDTVSLSQILSLTFTEKAAEEMKGRIYEMIGRIEKGLHARPAGKERLLLRIKDIREQFHRNRISTIHSFCADLLREHPVESGIDSGFTVIQGARQRKILAEAIETGVSWVWEHDHDLLFSLLQSFGNRRSLLRAIGHTIEHPLNFKRVIGTEKRVFQTKGWQGQVFREYCRIIKEEHLIPYLHGLRGLGKTDKEPEEVLVLLEEWFGKSDTSSKDFGVPDLFRKLRQISEDRKQGSAKLSIRHGLREISYPVLVETFFPDIFSSLSSDTIFAEQLRAFLRVAQVCLDRYEKEKKRINGLDFADLESLSHSFLTELFENNDPYGLKRVQRRFKYIMVDEFQDTNRVQWEILSLLCSDRGRDGEKILHPGKLFVVGDKRQAIYKFRGGDVTVFEHGTNRICRSNQGRSVPMFWQIPEIEGLLEEFEEGYSQFSAKQAVLFDALPRVERDKILQGDIYLPHNFRTAGRVIDFLNTTFDRIFSNKGAEVLYDYETAPRHIIMPDESEGVRQSQGSATFYLTRKALSRSDQAEKEANVVVDIIEAILGRHGNNRFEYNQYADIRQKIEENRLSIGILFFAFTHLKIFENVLREAGLSFKVHRGKGFYRSQEVMEMIQLLQYLCDERHHISLLAALRSPIFGLTDAEVFDLFYGGKPHPDQFLSSENEHVKSVGEQIQLWRELSHRLTVAELIRTIISDQGLTAVYSVHPNGKQRLANMEKLIEISRNFQMDGNGAISEFVEHCLEMAGEGAEEGEALIISEGESPIHLMTIHAAKGLEFPMVIIPDLSRIPPTRMPLGKSLRLYASKDRDPGRWNHREGEIPLWPVEIPEMDYGKANGPLGYLLMRRNRLEDVAENRRVFYVGCTRTMNHLLLMGHGGKRQRKKERSPLLTEDYRQSATIMDLLDDIYQFNENFPQEESSLYKGKKDGPSVAWTDPEPRPFQGIEYGCEKTTLQDFGEYDETVRKLDLTGPITAPPYHQFSFKSVQLYRRCSRKFYYSVILGLREDAMTPSRPVNHAAGVPVEGLERNDDWDYRASSDALFIGNVIHSYLERHCFGDPLNKDLLDRFCGRWAQLDSHGEGMDMRTWGQLKGKVFDHLKRTINDPSLLKFLGGKEEYAEVPFLFPVAHGCEFMGTIDRLFRDKDEGGWAILDWKSNAIGDKDPFQVAEEHDYHLQLACYKWAVEQILNEEVSGLYIYFTDKGRLIRSQWGGRPEEVIEEMIQRFQDPKGKTGQWDKGIGDIKDGGKCRHCAYRDVFCDRGETGPTWT